MLGVQMNLFMSDKGNVRTQHSPIMSLHKTYNHLKGYVVVVEYLTSSPVNDTRRHYKREYFIYKLFM